ncbi:MAG: glycosyltransferase family 2 protein [bacterium]
MKIAVLIPAYNEEQSIAETIQSLHSSDLYAENSQHSVESIVIDDGSSDQTQQRAREAGVDHIVRHPNNMGLGATVRTGLRTAREREADAVAKIDADLQHDIGDLSTVLEPILENRADVTYGNRFADLQYNMPLHRRLGNFLFTELMSALTGWPIKDSQPGIFAVSNQYLKHFYIPGDYNCTQQILIDAYHQGLRFEQVPVSFRKRAHGDSFISPSYPFRVLTQLIMVIVGVRPLKIFGTLGFLFLGSASIIFCWQITLWFQGLTRKPVVNVNLVLGLGLFGLQTLFFGFLAHLIVTRNRFS